MDDALKSEAGRQIIEAGKQLYAGGKEDGAQEEREAVVRWLIAWNEASDDPSLPRYLAGQIATGEHRKGVSHG